MKRFKQISFILIGLFMVSMIFPYEVHNEYSGGSWGSQGTLVKENVALIGLETYEAYGVLILMIIIALTTLIHRNLTTSIIGSVLSVVLLLGVPFILLTLLFELFGSNKRMGIGLAIAISVMILYFILQIINLVWEFRNRKTKKKDEFEDLLDTEF